MKKLFFACSVLVFSAAVNAQVKMPAPSPTQTIKQDFGIGSIEVTYSRPVTKGRKIFGGLEAYGTIWRTGANAATRIKFTEKVELAGKKIDTGTYVLYTIPGIDTWEVIINKGLSNWGIDGYKESEDVIRFKTEPIKLKKTIESLTMQFDNVKPESCDLVIMWDKTAISVPVTTNVKETIRTQIETAMLTEKKPYWQAAQFYNEYEKNSTKALEHVNNAVKENPTAFYMWLYKAKIENEMGDNAAAMVSSKKSLELSVAAKNDSYIKMNEELQKKLK